MRFKKVIFGRQITLQIACDYCDSWQFDNGQEFCDDCEVLIDREDITKAPTEYRSEIPNKVQVKDSVRKKVYERDEFTCQYCNTYCYDSWTTDKKQLTVDHLQPRTGGGRDNEENLVTCCRECNLLKSNKRFKTFEEARAFILKSKSNPTDHE